MAAIVARLAASIDAVGIGLLLLSAASLAIAGVVTGTRDVLVTAPSARWMAFAAAATGFATWRGERALPEKRDPRFSGA